MEKQTSRQPEIVRMGKNMKALMKLHAGQGGMALRQVEKPVPGPGEICVRIHAGGICGTDIHIMLPAFPPKYS